jgi:hypothetical protein
LQQRDVATKLNKAGLLSEKGLKAVMSEQKTTRPRNY